MEQDQKENKGIISVLLVVGTVGVLLPIMIPSWEWTGIAGWGTAVIAYSIAFAMALHRFVRDQT